jgi:hypothetical protein
MNFKILVPYTGYLLGKVFLYKDHTTPPSKFPEALEFFRHVNKEGIPHVVHCNAWSRVVWTGRTWMRR